MSKEEKYFSEVLDKLISNKEPDCYRIKINGKYVSMNSGKSSWARLGNAKNALHLQFYGSKNTIRWKYNLTSEQVDKLYKEFIDKNVEFIKVPND